VTFDHLVQIVDLIAGTMTILGAGGIVSWGFSRKLGNDLAGKVVQVFAYSIKTALALLLLIPTFWLWSVIYEFVFRRASGGTFSYVEPWWDSADPLPYICGYVASAPLIVPIYGIIVCALFSKSIAPLKALFETMFRPQGVPPAHDEIVSEVNMRRRRKRNPVERP
jgi:hypothetical protein